MEASIEQYKATKVSFKKILSPDNWFETVWIFIVKKFNDNSIIVVFDRIAWLLLLQFLSVYVELLLTLITVP